jgi:hypothetical protein
MRVAVGRGREETAQTPRPPAQRSAPAAEVRQVATASGDTLGMAYIRQFHDRVLARPKVAIALSATAIVLLVLIGASAPNNHTLEVPLPLPLLAPMPGIVSTVGIFTAITLSCLGLMGLLGAHSRGWRPNPRRLFAVGAVMVAVVANLTPVGSSDTASYAAYGRIAALGGDPYVMTPAQLGGPYAHLVSHDWLWTPSVYGPVATWLQSAAALVGGARPELTIWLLMMVNAAAFLFTGYVLIRTAGDPVRAALMWVANPLLIVLLVAGGHLDTFVAAFAVCAVQLARQSPRVRHDLAVGLFIGLAAGVKISAGLLGPALIWPLLCERAWARAARQAAACALVLVAGYAWYGPHALAPLSAASHMVSVPSVWAAFQQLGRVFLNQTTVSTLTSIGWPVLMFALGRVIRARVSPKAPPTVAWAFALTFAWILSAPWSMPWYTAIVWVTAALIPREPLVRWLILTTTVLAFGHNSGGHGWRW